MHICTAVEIFYLNRRLCLGVVAVGAWRVIVCVWGLCLGVVGVGAWLVWGVCVCMRGCVCVCGDCNWLMFSGVFGVCRRDECLSHQTCFTTSHID